MSKNKVILLGLLAYLPTAILLGFMAWIFVISTYPGDPPEPVPVIGLAGQFLFFVAQLVWLVLSLYYPTLPVVKRDEMIRVAALLLFFNLPALLWFWHTRILKSFRNGELGR